VRSHAGLITTLRGGNAIFGTLDHTGYTELDTEQRLSNPNLVFAEFYYLTRKCEARFYAGDYATAAQASLKADRCLDVVRAIRNGGAPVVRCAVARHGVEFGNA
jgi:hypothetical protein